MRWDALQGMFLVYPGGKAPAPATSSTTTNVMYSPEEAARRAKLMAEAERIYGQTQGGAQNLNIGQPSGETTAAQGMLQNWAQNNQLGPMAEQLQAAQIFGFDAATNPTAAPGFQDVLNTSLRKVNEAYTGPSGPFAAIRGAATGGSSGGSGSREGIAMGLAGRDYLNTIGDVTGRLTSDAYGKGLDLFSRTMAMTPQNMQAVTSAGMMPANVMSAIGQQKEAYDEKAGLWDINAPWQAMGPYAQMVTGMSNPSTQSTNVTPTGQRNPMAPLGAAAMGAMMFPSNPGIGAGAGLLLSLFS